MKQVKSFDLSFTQYLDPVISQSEDEFVINCRSALDQYQDAFAKVPDVHKWRFTPTEVLKEKLLSVPKSNIDLDYLEINKVYWNDLEQSIDALRHIFIKRGGSLFQSSINSINKKDSLAAAIIARSLLELSACALRHAAKIENTFTRLRDEMPLGGFRKQLIDCSEVQEILLLCIWGSRIRERTKSNSDLKQYTVPKILQEVADKEETPYLEALYDYLSEACHPNAVGNHQFIQYPEDPDMDSSMDVLIMTKTVGDESSELLGRTLGAIGWSSLALINVNAHMQNSLTLKKDMLNLQG